jgi:hypothetical protein
MIDFSLWEEEKSHEHLERLYDRSLARDREVRVTGVAGNIGGGGFGSRNIEPRD